MPLFRKKPVVVHALLYVNGLEDDFDIVPECTLPDDEDCLNDVECKECEKVLFYKKPYIKTLEGKMYISEGDYIITGIQGERYPCKPDIFKASYEEVISILGSEDSIIVKEDSND